MMFAMSGICFTTSCWFDRSKHAMGLGGGLSMFFLVATMLGLFGSPILPSIIRMDALNYFNYVSIITLFDPISILDGTGFSFGNSAFWPLSAACAMSSAASASVKKDCLCNMQYGHYGMR